MYECLDRLECLERQECHDRLECLDRLKCQALKTWRLYCYLQKLFVVVGELWVYLDYNVNSGPVLSFSSTQV